jgi:hypothetical protein
MERRPDDGGLAGERVAAADPVDLQLVPRTHGGDQHGIAQPRLGRQIGAEEEGRTRGSAAHEHTRNADRVGHAKYLPKSSTACTAGRCRELAAPNRLIS